MLCSINLKNSKIDIKIENNSAVITGGHFGEIKLLETALFNMRIKNLESSENIFLSSNGSWENVKFSEQDNFKLFCFENPQNIDGITVFVKAEIKENSISWGVEVVNNNKDFSVMQITYPTPLMTADFYDLFLPLKSGKVRQNAGKCNIDHSYLYPNHASMQYFAVYGKEDGIYIGIEDGKACSKRFSVKSSDDTCDIKADYFAEGGSLPSNSFKVSGMSKWQYLSGDWYDASLIYSDFVKREATWLPEIDENGRPDTAEHFKNMAFWISDYIPNSPSQGDNRPMSLSAGSDIYESSYWYKAPMLLQKELGVPVAYHVYNWHEIPFNIEYPHFLPAKEEFCAHAKELRENNIYVIPYINASGWEIHDAQTGHAVNFENTGCKGAAIKEDGSYVIENYPQITVNGNTCKLAMMCGASEEWHDLIGTLTEKMESTLDIDGVYFDEVAAVAAHPCYSKEHSHIPGGGSFWVDGYNRMMAKIRESKPKDNFYFSECNGEPFMKGFDGYLTWMWVEGNEVPAFPAVYAGYVQMIGRCTIGAKKDEFDFFKYCTAKSLLYGQQLGWCKADIVYSPKHMEFLKNAVDVRTKYASYLNSAYMLRPAKVETNLGKYETKSGLYFTDPINSEWVLSGAWRHKTNGKTVIFAVNFAEEKAEYKLTFDAVEYGIEGCELPEEFELQNNTCTVSGVLDKYEIKVWEF